jgi:energy-converting hydrogenase Eha subunit F
MDEEFEAHFVVFSLFLNVGLGLGFVSSVALMKIAEMEYCGTNRLVFPGSIADEAILCTRALPSVLSQMSMLY